MNKIISNYIITKFLKIVGNVIFGFVCLGVVLHLFEEIEFFKNLDVGLGIPLLLTLLFIPTLLIKLLPFIIFLSAMWYYMSINSNEDALTLRIFGFSNFKIISILSITAFCFGVLTLFIINPVSSILIKSYEKIKSNYAKDVDHLVAINKNGVWIKEIHDNKLRIVTAKKMIENNLFDVSIYELNDKSKISRRIESKKIDITNNTWLAETATIYDFNKEGEGNVIVNNFELRSLYNIEKIKSLYRNLDTISFVDLLTDYDGIIKKGYPQRLLDKKLNTFLTLPVFLFLMVFLAAIFTIKAPKKTNNLKYIFISILSCVTIYYFKDLSLALGETDRIPLVLSVWIPLIAITFICLIGIVQINEK